MKYNQLIQLRNYLDSQEEVKIIGFCDEINKERYEIYKKVLNEKHESENFHQKLKGNRIEFNYPNFGSPLTKI